MADTKNPDAPASKSRKPRKDRKEWTRHTLFPEGDICPVIVEEDGKLVPIPDAPMFMKDTDAVRWLDVNKSKITSSEKTKVAIIRFMRVEDLQATTETVVRRTSMPRRTTEQHAAAK